MKIKTREQNTNNVHHYGERTKEYSSWLADLKHRFREKRRKCSVSINLRVKIFRKKNMQWKHLDTSHHSLKDTSYLFTQSQVLQFGVFGECCSILELFPSILKSTTLNLSKCLCVHVYLCNGINWSYARKGILESGNSKFFCEFGKIINICNIIAFMKSWGCWWDRVSLSSSSYPVTHSVDQTASWVLGLKVCVTIKSKFQILKYFLETFGYGAWWHRS